jgi:glutamate N-acetyltransferase/amino-acid N-acetyltransferase
VFASGVPHDERSDEAAVALQDNAVTVTVDLGTGGPHEATMWTCDFSAEYVRINAAYRS